jgi:hypothetical protein
MVEGNITNQYPLTKIRNYYRMGDGILDGYPIIQDQTSPNLAHIPTTNLITYSEDLSVLSKVSVGTASAPVTTSNYAIAPDGTQTATRVVFNLNGGTSSGDRSILRQAIPSGSNYYFSIYVKSTDGTEQKILWHDGGEYNLTTVTNEWVRITYDGRPNLVYSGIALRGGEGVDSSDILAWGFQVEDQSQATAYIKSDGIAAVRKSSTTNLITYSEDFSNSYWTPTRSTITSNQIISPDGTLDADLLTATDTSENYIQTPLLAVSGTSQAVSFYVKKGTSDFAHILLWDSVNDGARQWFDLTNGTIGTSSSFGSGITVNNANMISYSNDWYRCVVVFNNSNTNIRTRVSASNSNGSTTSTVGKTIYIWGAQLEQQTQAETYAKTTGLPVTIDLFTENNYGTMTNMSASDIVEDTPNN